MSQASVPWDQRLARILVRPLVNTAVHPNHITALTALIALAGAALMASGMDEAMKWGATLFVFSRFLDHFDGELARQSGRSSKLGYVLDYLAGGVSYTALFAGMAFGLHAQLQQWVFVLGFVGCASAVLSVALNMRIDRATHSDDAVGYPALAGVELEDGIYLLAPVAWLGWLAPFFIAACLGAGIYLLYTLMVLLRAQRACGSSQR